MNMEMEKNIAASFTEKQAMEQATEALRHQGVIDIKILPPVRTNGSLTFARSKQDQDLLVELGEEMVYPLQVYVEKSRFRQAEDTIIRFGGKL